MDVGDLLDPEIKEHLGSFPTIQLSAELLPAMRQRPPGPPLSDAVERTEHEVPGDPPVPVRVHRARDAEGALPCIVSIHGGGMVLGTYDMDDAGFDTWCPELGVVGVSVEYRLAPDTPYPGPLEDCYRALLWVHENAATLGVDPTRIGVRGISAGGGLAAGLALLAKERGGPAIAFQLLDCPMIDDRQQTESSQLAGLPVWTKESNEFGWRSYLGKLHGSKKVPATAAPARATASELAGLPPAFVSVGTADGFLDEDVDYALRLNKAGVPCELHLYPGAPHGYQFWTDSYNARQSRQHQLDWLRKVLSA
jgi:acetyl esterase/lipase